MALHADEGLGEAHRDVTVALRGLSGLLEVGQGPLVVFLDQMDPRNPGKQLGVALSRLEGLLEKLQGLLAMPLLDELVGEGQELLGGLVLPALAGVQLGQPAPDLQIGRIQLGELPQHVAGVAEAVSVDALLVRHPEAGLGLGCKALPAVEVAEVEVGLQERRIVAVDLLPDRDRLEVEAVLGVEVRDLGVLLVGGLDVLELAVEVADPVDGGPVAGVFGDQLAQESDGLVEAPGALLLVGVLLELDWVDLCHAARPETSREQPALGALERAAVDAGRAPATERVTVIPR